MAKIVIYLQQFFEKLFRYLVNKAILHFWNITHLVSVPSIDLDFLFFLRTKTCAKIRRQIMKEAGVDQD